MEKIGRSFHVPFSTFAVQYQKIHLKKRQPRQAYTQASDIFKNPLLDVKASLIPNASKLSDNVMDRFLGAPVTCRCLCIP